MSEVEKETAGTEPPLPTLTEELYKSLNDTIKTQGQQISDLVSENQVLRNRIHNVRVQMMKPHTSGLGELIALRKQILALTGGG